jgi:hypothetical protein
MGTGWGDAFLSLSKSVPGVATAFDDEKKRREEEARKIKALEALAKWKKDMGEVDDYNNTNASMEQIDISPFVPTDAPGTSSPLPSDHYANLYSNNTRLGNLAKKSRLESAVDYGVVEGGAFDPGVKAVVDATNKTDTTVNGQTARTDWQMKKKMWDANPESMKNFLEQIDTLERNGVFTSDAANYWRSAARLDPVSAKIKVDDYVAKPDIAGLTVSAQTGPKVDQKRALIAPTVETTEAVEGAKTPELTKRAYLNKDATERAARDIQATHPMLKGDAATKVTQSAMALKNLVNLRDKLAAGNIEYFDMIKKTGQFSNPQVNNAFQQVSEIVGRQQSGAAINNAEWEAFGKEILNKNFLLTEAGQKTALENLNDYIGRFYSVGQLHTADDNWFESYSKRASTGIDKVGDTVNGEVKKRKVWNEQTGKFDLQ